MGFPVSTIGSNSHYTRIIRIVNQIGFQIGTQNKIILIRLFGCVMERWSRNTRSYPLIYIDFPNKFIFAIALIGLFTLTSIDCYQSLHFAMIEMQEIQINLWKRDSQQFQSYAGHQLHSAKCRMLAHSSRAWHEPSECVICVLRDLIDFNWILFPAAKWPLAMLAVLWVHLCCLQQCVTLSENHHHTFVPMICHMYAMTSE